MSPAPAACRGGRSLRFSEETKVLRLGVRDLNLRPWLRGVSGLF